MRYVVLQAGFKYYENIVQANYERDYQTYLELEDLKNLHFIEVGGRGAQFQIDLWKFAGDTKNPVDDGERICSSVQQALHRAFEFHTRALVIIDNMWFSVALNTK